jgi:branched-chain amino acid aminotransferase
MIVWRNGGLIEASRAVPADDRGYLVGDGVFETMLLRNGKPAFLDAHLARIRRGAGALDMEPQIDRATVLAAIGALTSQLGQSGEAVCRITLSRSGGARGLAPSSDAAQELLIALHPAPARKPRYRLIVAQTPRFSRLPTNGFKCVGAYGSNLLARLEAARANADDAIMLNESGRIACASAANVFLVSEAGLMTPPESEGAMPGVTRAVLLEIAAEEGVAVRIEPVPRSALDSSALILTNSVIGAVGASMANEVPNSLVALLSTAYEKRLGREFSEASA